MEVLTPGDEQPVRYARQSCLPCRRSKRRCDKKVPSCDLCIRKEVDCSYAAPRGGNRAALAVQRPAGWTSNTPALDPFVAASPLRESDANAIYFLAPHVFQQARLQLLRPELPIPIDVSSLIGDVFFIRNIASTYFTTVHKWFPFLSKQGFFTHLLNPLAKRRTELSLLALCMKLCCTGPSDEEGDGGTKTALYRAAKRFHQEAETAGLMSIHVLQAGILIAFYEMAQAIYPAAYLTIGACARYGLALGVDKLCLPAVGDGDSDGPRSWIEVEEGKRGWWAVLIFDRFLSFGNPLRPLSTNDPTFDTYLPVDDAAWDDCTAKPEDVVQISRGFTLETGGFARLGQATYLLSQALRSIPVTAADGDVTRHDDTAQLRRTLLALLNVADIEAKTRRLEFCTHTAVCLSTILLLQEHELKLRDASAKDDQGKDCEPLWGETYTAIDRLSSATVAYNGICPMNPGASDHIPVFLIQVMFQVASILLRVAPGTVDQEAGEKLKIFKNLLQILDSRWRLAGVYLNILEAREITMSSEAMNTRHSASEPVPLPQPPPL